MANLVLSVCPAPADEVRPNTLTFFLSVLVVARVIFLPGVAIAVGGNLNFLCSSLYACACATCC